MGVLWTLFCLLSFVPALAQTSGDAELIKAQIISFANITSVNERTEDGQVPLAYAEAWSARVGVLLYSKCNSELTFPIDRNSFGSCVFQCTAFLVSDFHVVTTGTCAKKNGLHFIPALTDVREPLTDFAGDIDSEKTFGVAKVEGYILLSGELALVRLDRRVGKVTGHFKLAPAPELSADWPADMRMLSYPSSASCQQYPGDNQWERGVTVNETFPRSFTSDVLACGGDGGAPVVGRDAETEVASVYGVLVGGSTFGGCGTCGTPNRFTSFDSATVAEIEGLICEDDCECNDIEDKSNCTVIDSRADIWDADRVDDNFSPKELDFPGNDDLYVGSPASLNITFWNLGTSRTDGIMMDVYIGKEVNTTAAFLNRTALVQVASFEVATVVPVKSKLLVGIIFAIPTQFRDRDTVSVYVHYNSISLEYDRDPILHWSSVRTLQLKGGPGIDQCPGNNDLWERNACGCVSDVTDSDNDGAPDCVDECPYNPDMQFIGICGCNADDQCDDKDLCPRDGMKTEPGVCGCGHPDIDSDEDGVLDCLDECPVHASKQKRGFCGCGQAETDSDGDGVPDCIDLVEDTKDTTLRSGKCFPANAKVDVLDKGVISIENLQIGDFVRVNKWDFSEVFFFGHRDPNATSKMVKLSAAGNIELELSPSHLLPVSGKLITADTVKVGDVLLLANGGSAPVKRISTVLRRGLFNPHTMSDFIAVDGVVASTMTDAVPLCLARALLLPFKALYKLHLASPFQGILDTNVPRIEQLLQSLFGGASRSRAPHM
eukprot:Plantae.Rhodophyta-Purpureofilum_apyrenoidigerum.ctg1300.p1 GENE.Plantae.Rhodophyta-Purpureofilum_apyrenoidigerum.ctg1300~~Plantae.Rhodophyta-Purpureofilum_apyrenoidigerum.ctg1300.p1  ORF type:complete len:774 (-),score=115.49 Plantae.Rhodophyta-Purpureofilum_apyrenoidigerum.ctg1300:108-2429(-)